MIPWSIATNMYQKGETLRHQVKMLDKIGYIKSQDGDTKIEQDMLFVSIPFSIYSRPSSILVFSLILLESPPTSVSHCQ